MNAEPLLKQVAQALQQVKLEAVMVGNAAAALHGAPVTTVDIDFMFRKTPANIRKLKNLARLLGGVILRPYYPASQLYRLSCDSRGIQLDFMPRLEGVRSFAGLRSRAKAVRFGKHSLLVASLADIIASKIAAARPQDLAVLPVLNKTLKLQEKQR